MSALPHSLPETAKRAEIWLINFDTPASTGKNRVANSPSWVKTKTPKQENAPCNSPKIALEWPVWPSRKASRNPPDRLQEALRIGYNPGTSKIELVTVNQATRIMMVSPITIYRMVYAGKLTRYPVGNGRSYRINRYELFNGGAA